jgi:hypothetical protein
MEPKFDTFGKNHMLEFFEFLEYSNDLDCDTGYIITYGDNGGPPYKFQKGKIYQGKVKSGCDQESFYDDEDEEASWYIKVEEMEKLDYQWEEYSNN